MDAPIQNSDLPRSSVILRLAVIGMVLVTMVGAFSYVGGWLTPYALSPTSMVDRFQQVNGEYSGFRRNHAKGVCITGTFESNGEGVALSRAAVFPRGRVPFVGRFALAGGLGIFFGECLHPRGIGLARRRIG